MTLIHITFKTIPENKRYTILSNGKDSAVYKRIFPLIYWRVSRVYTEYEVWTEVVKEYERLTNLITKK